MGKLENSFRNTAQSTRVVEKWFTEFYYGHKNDCEHSGSSIQVATPGTIYKIQDMLLADQRINLREIVEAAAKIVPRFLPIDDKRIFVTNSKK